MPHEDGHRLQSREQRSYHTAKISTNSALAAAKPSWIDFNAGGIVDGMPSEVVDKAFMDFVLNVASGAPVNNEKSDYAEIAIFKSGVTL